LLLRTFRFPEIRTCETTDELGWVTIKICPVGADRHTDRRSNAVNFLVA